MNVELASLSLKYFQHIEVYLTAFFTICLHFLTVCHSVPPPLLAAMTSDYIQSVCAREREETCRFVYSGLNYSSPSAHKFTQDTSDSEWVGSRLCSRSEIVRDRGRTGHRQEQVIGAQPPPSTPFLLLHYSISLCWMDELIQAAWIGGKSLRWLYPEH